jgi:hypothetical protein
MPDIYNDGSFQAGSYDANIGGYPYTFDTADHDLPISQADANYASGLPRGGVFVLGKRKLSVKINALNGIPAPVQLKPFALAVDGFPSAWWIVGNLKISSANDGAKIRTYSADIIQLIQTPAA